MADCDFIAKRCTKCGETKNIACFSVDKQKKDGLSCHCKSCKATEGVLFRSMNKESGATRARAWRLANLAHVKAQRKAYYEQDKTKAIDQSRAWRINNPERHAEALAIYAEVNRATINAKKAAYRIIHIERFKARSKAYSALNADANNARGRKWAKDNPARRNANVARRRATEFRATPAWADAAAIVLVYKEARDAERRDGIKRHVDHIVPLQSKIVCGLHTAGNLQILSDLANRQKSNRHWPDMPT